MPASRWWFAGQVLLRLNTAAVDCDRQLGSYLLLSVLPLLCLTLLLFLLLLLLQVGMPF
jgi:hypothetical protein